MNTHITRTSRIEDGWKFFCDECDYLLFYTDDNGLVVVNSGNTNTTHTSELMEEELPNYLQNEIGEIIEKAERK